ncbi:hypothetical protein VN97_g7014 [Penicillium thymicola]|uniref:Uncharacterized protein n=1 Tax=Penicillium thymicola TaxID=293382 RepID=A0AAI9X740_PENTH|nr:hypothetical protein VN97_g7014 [Penicillium thymicola]
MFLLWNCCHLLGHSKTQRPHALCLNQTTYIHIYIFLYAVPSAQHQVPWCWWGPGVGAPHQIPDMQFMYLFFCMTYLYKRYLGTPLT